MGTSTKVVRLCAIAAAAAIAAVAGVAEAAVVPFTTGNLVVTRVNGNGAALTSNATQVDLVELTTAGAAVQTITMPTADSGSTHAYSASGTQVEQFLTLSGDKRYLTLAGYNATLGTTSPANSASIGRVIARVDSNGNVDTSTVLTDAGAASNNIRSVYSADGSTFYTTTAATGTRYVGSLGATTSTLINSGNARNVMISGGQLYVSSGSNTNIGRGVNPMGAGTPTTGPQTAARLPGMTDATTASSWDFFFANSTTLYVADDSSSSTVGGLQKWVFDGSTWSMVYRMYKETGTSTQFGIRSITAAVDGDNVLIYATNNEGSSSVGNRLVVLTDSLSNTVAANAPTWTAIASSGNNMQFRSVEFAPTAVPEPASVGLVALGGLALAQRARKA